jgi:HSP20 family protein
MSTLPVQRHVRSLFPEFSELFAGFPSFAGHDRALTPS